MTPGKEQQVTGSNAHGPLGTGAPQTPALCLRMPYACSRQSHREPGVGGAVREKEAAPGALWSSLRSHAYGHVTARQLTPETKQVGFRCHALNQERWESMPTAAWHGCQEPSPTRRRVPHALWSGACPAGWHHRGATEGLVAISKESRRTWVPAAGGLCPAVSPEPEELLLCPEMTASSPQHTRQACGPLWAQAPGGGQWPFLEGTARLGVWQPSAPSWARIPSTSPSEDSGGDTIGDVHGPPTGRSGCNPGGSPSFPYC